MLGIPVGYRLADAISNKHELRHALNERMIRNDNDIRAIIAIQVNLCLA